MKRNILTKNTLNGNALTLFCILVSMLALFWGKGFTGAVTRGLSLWVAIVLPALLPYAFLSALFVNENFPYRLSGVTHRAFCKLFGVGKNSCHAFFINLVSGCPLGIKKIADLKNSGLIGNAESVRASVLCSTPSPMYLLAVGSITFGHRRLGLCLLLATFLSTFTISFCFRFYKPNELPSLAPLPKLQYQNAFFESLSSCLTTMLTIGVTLSLFSVMVDFLIATSLLSPLVALFSKLLASENLGNAMAIGLIESTWGIKLLGATNLSLAFPLAGILTSLGGINGLIQPLIHLKKAKIKTAPFLVAKIVQAVICFLLCLGFGAILGIR